MQILNFPYHEIKQKNENGKAYIYAHIRKKYVVSTPEEWVRQHLIHFLIEERNFPKTLIAIETSLRVNGLKKRTDLLVFDKKTRKVCLIAECKAPNIKISQAVFEQIARYNISLQTNFLIVTNGLKHYCCQINLKEKTYHFLNDIPFYEDVIK
ncbi:MAG: type I restriction enzyme HsdR N-terminal domain-containing protein [Chitinophagales bacterium]